MTWDQFLNVKTNSGFTGQVQTDIECPSCGRHIYLNMSIFMTSYPIKYAYWCSCGWSGYAPIRWADPQGNLFEEGDGNG